MLAGALLTQGLYYLLTGLWPIIDITSFQKVTGPKRDVWLVICVGSVITIIAVTLLVAVITKNTSPAILTLAVGSSLALTLIDVKYVFNRTISPIYLLDAVLEIAILIWIATAILLFKNGHFLSA